jgi:hypothetical protein
VNQVPAGARWPDCPDNAATMWMRGTITGVLATAALLPGCGGSGSPGGCPVTKPGGPRPPADALTNLGTPIARRSGPGWYGNGALWTNLPWSTQFIRTPSGLLSTKIPWFRARTGTVTVDARPLHGPPARFTADVGSPASYGPTGFSPSILAFGRTGCWVVHARLAGKALEVVFRVYPAAPG